MSRLLVLFFFLTRGVWAIRSSFSPRQIAKTIAAAISVILTRIESAPDYNTVAHAPTIVQNGVKTTTETVQTIAMKAQWAAEASHRATLKSQQTKAGTQDAEKLKTHVAGCSLVRVGDEVHDIVVKVSKVIRDSWRSCHILESGGRQITNPNRQTGARSGTVGSTLVRASATSSDVESKLRLLACFTSSVLAHKFHHGVPDVIKHMFAERIALRFGIIFI